MDGSIVIRQELRLSLLTSKLSALTSGLMGLAEGIASHLVDKTAVAGLALARDGATVKVKYLLIQLVLGRERGLQEIRIARLG